MLVTLMMLAGCHCQFTPASDFVLDPKLTRHTNDRCVDMGRKKLYPQTCWRNLARRVDDVAASSAAPIPPPVADTAASSSTSPPPCLTRDWAVGKLSSRQVQENAEGAKAQGADGVMRMAAASGHEPILGTCTAPW